MADLAKIVEDLSALSVLEAAELSKMLPGYTHAAFLAFMPPETRRLDLHCFTFEPDQDRSRNN